MESGDLWEGARARFPAESLSVPSSTLISFLTSICLWSPCSRTVTLQPVPSYAPGAQRVAAANPSRGTWKAGLGCGGGGARRPAAAAAAAREAAAPSSEALAGRRCPAWTGGRLPGLTEEQSGT